LIRKEIKIIRPEIALIKILLNIDLYNKYRSYININKEDREVLYLYSTLDKMMESYNRSLSFDEYQLTVTSNIQDKDSIYDTILDNLSKVDIAPDVAESLLVQFKERRLAHDIALLAIAVEEGQKSFQDLHSTIQQHESQVDPEITTEFVSDILEDLYQNQVLKHGLRWRLNTLNRMLGSLRKGDFGFIFARPETGKTTFLASEITFFAQQVDGPILWFNNEEQGSKVMLRCIQASLGCTTQDLFTNLAANQLAFNNNGGQYIKIFDSASIHRRQIEQLCKELNPSLIVVDQGDKIKGFPDDREDLRLGSIYIFLRELAKQYCPVIAICQADASGEGKRWLTMENVANAKTSKQAEADWILGIGKTHDTALEYIRHFHLSKNKLAGDEESDPSMRHGRMDVLIQPEIARYKDIEEN